jgi:hypothetical protein
MKVLVCDDEKNRCDDVVRAIDAAAQSDVSVNSLCGGTLTTELMALFDKVKIYLQDPKSERLGIETSFDNFDMVFLDNNLAHLDIKGTILTAEAIAGYMRAFTTTPYIISLNKNSDVDFDLRYLVGDYETRADLALNTKHLANAALWTGRRTDTKDAYLPWYWPALGAVSDRRRSQIAFIHGKLSDPVFGALGIPSDEGSLGFLSLHAQGTLSPDATSDGMRSRDGGIPIDTLTFRDVFLGKNRSLPTRDERCRIVDAADAGSADAHIVISRVVAGDIDFWFRRDVLGPQEMLVDVPHLLMRMPFLLGTRASDIEQWNRTIDEATPPFGLEQPLFEAHLKKEQFQHPIWVPSPSFWWSKLKADEKLAGLFFETKPEEWCDAVFCEDRSEFSERSAAAEKTAPIEFSTEFEGSWARRYVARIPGYRYSPLMRFSV